MYFISFAENAYHAILVHNGNQRAGNRKGELREGRIFTKILGRIFVTVQKNISRIQFVRSELHSDRETAL
jgi:hypothetical protein